MEDTLDYNDRDDERLLGDEEDDDGVEASRGMRILRSMDRSTDGGSAEGSSFESNTEPIIASDYLKQHRPSGPFLEPPRQGAEVKRQKYKYVTICGLTRARVTIHHSPFLRGIFLEICSPVANSRYNNSRRP